MIAVEDLAVRYAGAATTALDGVTLRAERGALTALVGPNGSGKSTLVRAMLGRVPVERGRILVDGQDALTLSRRAFARRVAVVTQRDEPAFPLLGREYIALGRFAHGSLFRAAQPDDPVVDAAAQRASVTAFLDRRTDQLSGGEWQRLRIARALAQGGAVLVLDEPTTFLDIGHEMGLFELLADLARAGLAVLLVSHQLNLVARFAEQVVLLHRGRVVAAGTPAAVMQAPILESVYEWPLVIAHDPAVGAPMLVPLRR
jgi:ABC-type cobalamin/Fe3+-siderophores transport system ATPase subunit